MFPPVVPPRPGPWEASSRVSEFHIQISRRVPPFAGCLRCQRHASRLIDFVRFLRFPAHFRAVAFWLFAVLRSPVFIHYIPTGVRQPPIRSFLLFTLPSPKHSSFPGRNRCWDLPVDPSFRTHSPSRFRILWPITHTNGATTSQPACICPAPLRG